MRYVDPNSEPIPAEINYSNINADITSLIFRDNYQIQRPIYIGSVKTGGIERKTVVEALVRKYKNKCGYCESVEYNPSVEHHRPKGFVTGGKVNNIGYYWLAYEWTNFVASCSTCNEPPSKGTKFPIVSAPCNEIAPLNAVGGIDFSKFRYDHSFNQDEKPLLLHPEYTNDPERHFDFNKAGEITHLTPEGQCSISTYYLDRLNLNVLRRGVYENFNDQIDRLIRRRFRKIKPITHASFLEELGEVLALIINRRNNEFATYSLFTKKMIEKFEYFFIEHHPNLTVRIELKNTFREIFDEILN